MKKLVNNQGIPSNIVNSFSEEIDKLIFIANNHTKTRVRVPFVNPSTIEVGKKYWHIKNFNMMQSEVELIEITHIRSNVVFFTSDKREKEDYFPVGCYMSSMLEPEIYETDMNQKYYEFVSMSEKVKVKYVK